MAQGETAALPLSSVAPLSAVSPVSQPHTLRVEVAYCQTPATTDLVTLTLPAGSSLADALHASGLQARHALGTGDLHVGVWGKAQPLNHPLRDGDRVEVYRPLKVDPKEARRQRYQQHRGQQAKQRRGTSAG